MNKTIKKTLFLAASILLITACNTAAEEPEVDPNDPTQHPWIPEDEEITYMTDRAIRNLGGAINAKDFTNFYVQEVAEIWKEQGGVTPEEMLTWFPHLVENEVDLVLLVTGETPELTEPAYVDENNVMHLNGKYAYGVNALFYDLDYYYEIPEWRLVGIQVKIEQDTDL